MREIFNEVINGVEAKIFYNCESMLYFVVFCNGSIKEVIFTTRNKSEAIIKVKSILERKGIIKCDNKRFNHL